MWLVREGEKLYLVPVRGSDADWYKNVLKTPTIRLAAGGAQHRANARPISDAVAVNQVLDKFRELVHEPFEEVFRSLLLALFSNSPRAAADAAPTVTLPAAEQAMGDELMSAAGAPEAVAAGREQGADLGVELLVGTGS